MKDLIMKDLNEHLLAVIACIRENQNFVDLRVFPPLSILGFTESQLIEVDTNGTFFMLSLAYTTTLSNIVITRKGCNNTFRVMTKLYNQALQVYGLDF